MEYLVICSFLIIITTYNNDIISSTKKYKKKIGLLFEIKLRLSLNQKSSLLQINVNYINLINKKIQNTI